MPLAFALLFHAHQPAGNFDEVIERTYEQAYAPLLEALAARAGVRFNLHFSGYLLDWLGARHPDYLERIAGLVRAGQAEVLGGGYYEPILPALREADRRAQLRRLSERVEHWFGERPRGLWLAERVWEPDLPATLAGAGLEYTVLDDAHFLLAGLAPEELHGSFLTESQGAAVRVIPSSWFLRQAIPFQPEAAAIEYLQRHAAGQSTLLCMGDDLEKFGSWPHTHEHVYRQGWLARFLDRLEAAGEIATVRLGDYVAGHAPRGRVYLPAASYPEMMQWAMPAQSAELFAQALADEAVAPYRRFLAGAPWRAFLAKYTEANLLHKTQLDLSRRLEAWREQHPPGNEDAIYREALDHLHAGQANDGYWHGWFGGLYAPHLREFLFRQLLQAGTGLERLEGAQPLRQLDIDLDGYEEVEMSNPQVRALVTPADGGTVAELDWRPGAANLINALQRRPELYHRQIRAGEGMNPAQLPGEAAAPAAGLERHLRYDRYQRSMGRLLLLEPGTTFANWIGDGGNADEDAAGGAYAISRSGGNEVALRGKSSAGAAVEKQYRLRADGLELECRLEAGEAKGKVAAVEMVLNLLAPDAEDRSLEQGGRRMRLDYTGELAAGPLEWRDGWRRLCIRMEAPGAERWWVGPIRTVSQSDQGLEAIYQGSAAVAVWPAGTATMRVRVRIAKT